jgi:UDP-2,4-diacetamido-2,4,6-trideoxy-beta-L-altropyranose hydrolase
VKVAIRTDASLSIGSGHVMRCLALAEALREAGAQVRFVCRAHPGHMGEQIAARGFALQLLAPGPDGAPDPQAPVHAHLLGAGWEHDADATVAALRDDAPDWLVVDHYALDARWERRLRALGARMLAIDDLADRAHDCEVLLDQNYAGSGERYAALLGPGCRPLLGPAFALLRPEFAHARAAAAPRAGAVRRLFIFFGGIDAPNLTAVALQALQLLANPELQIDVVVGKDNPHQAEVEALCRALPGCTLHRQVDRMAAMMAAADIALGAGGVTTWERCCVGLASVIVTIAANQEPSVRALARDGYAIAAGASGEVDPAGLGALLAPLLAAPAALRAMAARAAALVDGAGCARVAQVLAAPRLTLRRAGAADVRLYYDWAGDAQVRVQSLNSDPIPFEQHQAWFERRVASADSVLLVAELPARGPVGQVRFDQFEGGWRIGFSLGAPWRGQGLAAPMLAAAIECLAHSAPQARLVAQVKQHNLASSKAFLALGFDEPAPAIDGVHTYVRNLVSQRGNT